MYLQYVLLSTLLLSSVSSLQSTQLRNDLALGHRQQNDIAIETRVEKARGPGDFMLNYSKTYVGNNEYIITRIVIEDVSDGSGALASVIAGGPGSTFVTLSYSVPRRTDMAFNVTVYGKIPVYRKVV